MAAGNKVPLFFCRKCGSCKQAKFVIIFPEDSEGKRDTGITTEVIRSFEHEITIAAGTSEEKKEKRTFKARQLECNHFISFYTPAFNDSTSENLSESETLLIRQQIEKDMIGKTPEEIRNTILLHVDQYNVLLKLSQKSVKQARYAIIFLDELKEKWAGQLNEEEEKNFKMKFAHFLDQKPTTPKVIERQKAEVKAKSDTKEDALEAVKKLLAGKGYAGGSMADLFKAKEENKQ